MTVGEMANSDDLRMPTKRRLPSRGPAKALQEQAFTSGLKTEWSEKKFTDLTFRCGPKGHDEVTSHRVVVGALSPALRSAMAGLGDADVVVIHVPEVDHEVLAEFLGNVYVGGEGEVEIHPTLRHLGFKTKVRSPRPTVVKVIPDFTEFARNFAKEATDLLAKQPDQRFGSSDGGSEEEYVPKYPKPRVRTKRPTNGTRNSNRSVKRLTIWKYFKVIDEVSASCLTCQKSVRTENSSTTSLTRHLKFDHVEKFKELDSGTGQEDPEHETNEKVPAVDVLKQSNHANVKNIDAELDKRTMQRPSKIIEEKKPKSAKPKKLPGPEAKTCPDCQKLFSCRPAMLYHRRTVHSGVRPHKCEDCGATFARLDSFKAHSHSLERSFLCSVCGKAFARKNIRDVHERSHYGDKRYNCGHCEKKFMTNQQRKNHERVHTGERPFQCTECGGQVAQQHQLTTHTRIHTGEKPYSCGDCGMTFRHLSSKGNHKCSAGAAGNGTHS